MRGYWRRINGIIWLSIKKIYESHKRFNWNILYINQIMIQSCSGILASITSVVNGLILELQAMSNSENRMRWIANKSHRTALTNPNWMAKHCNFEDSCIPSHQISPTERSDAKKKHCYWLVKLNQIKLSPYSLSLSIASLYLFSSFVQTNIGFWQLYWWHIEIFVSQNMDNGSTHHMCIRFECTVVFGWEKLFIFNLMSRLYKQNIHLTRELRYSFGQYTIS